MSQLTQILQNLVNQDDKTKIELAVHSYLELESTFKVLDPETEGMGIIYAILGTTVVADGKLTEGEYGMIEGILSAKGLSSDREAVLGLVNLAANRKQDAYNIVRAVRERLNDEGTADLLNFIAAICAIDDTISKEEIELIESLL